MSDRFPPLRPQESLSNSSRLANRAVPTPSPVDLTVLAALVFVVALAIL